MWTDTEQIHKQSVTAVAAKFGKTYNLDLRYKVLGAPELDGAKMVVNELKLPISIEEYISMVRAFESKVMPDVDLLPGSYHFYFIFCPKQINPLILFNQVLFRLQSSILV